MTAVKLPGIIQDYVNASNGHDMNSILSCFSDSAVVRDEAQELRGKKPIEKWITETIKKYKFHFKPLGIQGDDAECLVQVEVSGTFDGSPVTLDYRFVIEDAKISSLTIN